MISVHVEVAKNIKFVTASNKLKNSTTMTLHQDFHFMKRCITLANKAGKFTQSNPKVGALLVYKDKVIGEGYHEKYGSAHAEVNAINAVCPLDRDKIPFSTLYVSLEPCSHSGKTPPCANRIVSEQIPKVVIGCKDPNPLVAGNGIKFLKSHGVHVTYPILENETERLLTKFKANLQGLPFVILKWAQSSDGFISKKQTQIWLSNEYSRILTHKWRSEVDGIMVGKNTVYIDNPSLDVRVFKGESPIRVLMDTDLTINNQYKILNNQSNTIIINQIREQNNTYPKYLKVDDNRDLLSVLKKLYLNGIMSIMVEGGSELLNSFITSGYWHEARVIKTKVKLHDGIAAPWVDGLLLDQITLQDDKIIFIANPHVTI